MRDLLGLTVDTNLNEDLQEILFLKDLLAFINQYAAETDILARVDNLIYYYATDFAGAMPNPEFENGNYETTTDLLQISRKLRTNHF